MRYILRAMIPSPTKKHEVRTMKKCKVVFIAVLAVVLLALGACNGESADQNDDPSDWHHPLTDYDVILNGEPVPGASHIILNDDIFPTHVTLLPILHALGTGVTVENGTVTLAGMNGRISFVIGESSFEVDGRAVSLANSSVEIDGVIYVPIPFFRVVYGMGQAGWMSGHVIIDVQADDMH